MIIEEYLDGKILYYNEHNGNSERARIKLINDTLNFNFYENGELNKTLRFNDYTHLARIIIIIKNNKHNKNLLNELVNLYPEYII